jgi:hypothetical protein
MLEVGCGTAMFHPLLCAGTTNKVQSSVFSPLGFSLILDLFDLNFEGFDNGKLKMLQIKNFHLKISRFDVFRILNFGF